MVELIMFASLFRNCWRWLEDIHNTNNNSHSVWVVILGSFYGHKIYSQSSDRGLITYHPADTQSLQASDLYFTYLEDSTEIKPQPPAFASGPFSASPVISLLSRVSALRTPPIIYPDKPYYSIFIWE